LSAINFVVCKASTDLRQRSPGWCLDADRARIATLCWCTGMALRRFRV